MKDKLRNEIKAFRKNMNQLEKNKADHNIFEKISKFCVVKKAKLVLIYLSTDIEVDTKKIIDYCLENNIKVAVPKCVGKHVMKFYYYNKNTILKKSKFGIYEPLEADKNLVNDFSDAICIVPALAYNKEGFRLGYGGGFYDRFISENMNILTVGLCYDANITDDVIVEENDQKVDFIVTETKLEVCNG